MLRALFGLAVLIPAAAAAQQPRVEPTFEDQLYLLGRAQEEQLKELRRQNEEQKKQIDELKAQIAKGEQK